jgi:raffinose/stachyose/melibiose transport system substrate-binding protein
MKSMAKATAAGAIALVAVITLASCASDSNAGGAAGGGAGDSLSIGWLTTETKGLEAVIEAFKEENPGIDVRVSSAETGAYQANLRTQLSSGTAPDVIYAWSPNNAAGIRTLDEGGFLEDLSDEPWADDYFESVSKETQSEDGRTLLMAPQTQGFSAIYNQTALDEAGLEAPATLDAMWGYCDAATKAGKVPYALPGAEQYGSHAAFMTLAADLVYGDGFQFDEDIRTGATTFPTNEGYIKSYELFEKMLESGCFASNSSGVNFDELGRQVATGEALGSIVTTTRLGLIQEMNPDATFVLTAFDSDNNPDTNKEILAIQGGAAIPTNGENTELAKEFVRFLADNIGLYWEQHPGSALTMPDKVDIGNDANAQFQSDVLANGDNVPYLNNYWCAEAEAAMVAGNQGIVVGTTTGPEVLKSMQAAYDACG